MSKFDSMQKLVKSMNRKAEKNQKINYLGTFEETKATPDTRMLTGMLELDYLFGGGLMLGSVIEVTGQEGVGKSTILMRILEKAGYIYDLVPYFNDVESTGRDEKFLSKFPLMKSHKMFKDSEGNIEDFFDKLNQLSNYVDIIIIDSVTKMSREGSEDLSKADMGKTAGIWSRGWSRMGELTRKGIRIFLVNELRDNLDPYAPKSGEHTSGGRALKYAKTGQLVIKKDGGNSVSALKDKDEFGNEKVIGWKILLKLNKNKQGQFGKSITSFLWTDEDKEHKYDTYDDIKVMIGFALQYGIIENVKKTFNIINQETGEIVDSIVGKDALENFFRENPEKTILLTIWCYKHMLEDSFFYCLWDKILLIARANVIMGTLKQKLLDVGKLNFNLKIELENIKEYENKLLEDLKEQYSLDKFFDKDTLSKLQNIYGTPWTWGILNDSGDEDEETEE